MITVGLTGGIACGKSTVSRHLESLGAVVIDADQLVHSGFQAGEALNRQVLHRFGSSYQAEDGSVDRRALGALVFSDPSAKADLEAIVHPWVREAALDLLKRHEPTHDIGVFDAALLIESGGHRVFDLLVVVACSEQTQLQRLMDRDKLNEAEATRRIQAQMPIDKKRSYADYVVETEGTLAETEAKTKALWEWLQAKL